MAISPEKTILRWLRQLHIPVPGSYFTEQLKGHPHYPSLLSITDSLEAVGIESLALTIEKEQLIELETPFLAHLDNQYGEFVLVKNRDQLDKQFPGFFEKWSGVVLLAEKPEGWPSAIVKPVIQKERAQKNLQLFALALPLLVICCTAFRSQFWVTPVLLLIALAGIFVSWMIVSKELGIENSMADSVCGRDNHCEALIQAKDSKLPGGIGWGDVGLTWFSGMLVSLLLSILMKKEEGMLGLLAVLSTGGIAFSFFSLYYQWRVAKRWCRLCLLTLVLLVSQFTLLAPLLYAFHYKMLFTTTSLITVFVLTATAGIWILIRIVLKENKKLQETVYNGTKFKRDETIFELLLSRQKKVDVQPGKYDLQLGNPYAPVQITVACNPYCHPCAELHEKLHHFLETNDEGLGLTVKFTMNGETANDRITLASKYILQVIKQQIAREKNIPKESLVRSVLFDWFSLMDQKLFAAKYPLLDDLDVRNAMSDHRSWIKRSGINATPTIFINGFEKPDAYEIEDIFPILKRFKSAAAVYNVAGV